MIGIGSWSDRPRTQLPWTVHRARRHPIATPSCPCAIFWWPRKCKDCHEITQHTGAFARRDQLLLRHRSEKFIIQTSIL